MDMKKNLLLKFSGAFLFLSLLCFNSFGQAKELPFNDDFESYADNAAFLANSGWTLVDGDGDGKNWYLHHDSTDDINVMASRSYEGGALTPENYLVTPKLNLPVIGNKQNIVVSFDVAATGNNFFSEKYKIVVSKTGTAKADFTDVVFTETLTESERGWRYAKRSVNLNAFAGNEVYVAIVHFETTDKDRIVINNFSVSVEAEPLELPFAEDFEGYEDDAAFKANSSWSVIDGDGDGKNWYLHYDSFDKINVMVSRSYEGGALTPENYLVTPKLKLPEIQTGQSIELSYVVAATGNNYFTEKYKVVVSVTGATKESFTEILLTETLTEAEKGWGYAARSVDLSAFAGKQVYVAFVHFDCTDLDRIVINNVAVKLEDGSYGLPFSEDFEKYADQADFDSTSNWTLRDADGDEKEWYLFNDETNGTKVMASQSYSGAALTPENYLITPKIKLPSVSSGFIVLDYMVAATGNTYFEEKYKVVVSETGTNPEDFKESDIIISETLTTNERGRRYGSRSLDLTAYAGKSIYIAFVHFDCTDQDRILLDNVYLRTVNSAALSPMSAEFNPVAPADITTTMQWYGASSLTAIDKGGVALVAGTDYMVTVIDEKSSLLTFKPVAFTGAVTGDLPLTLTFNSGDPVVFTVNVTAVPTSAVISPEIADFNPADAKDVPFTITWGDATQVISVSAETVAINTSHYKVEGNTLTILKEFFAEKEPAFITLIVKFDQGSDASVIVRVMDNSVRTMPYTEPFTGLTGATTPEAWLPNGWRVADSDGDTFNWYWVPVNVDGVFSYGRMQSRSSYQNAEGEYVALTPDNWLISPPIKLGDITSEDQKIELKFKVAPGANTPRFRRENYSIMISYTDNKIASFDKIFDERIQETHPQNQMQERVVDLSYYEGQTVYVAIRHHDCTDLDRLLFNDFSVRMSGTTSISEFDRNFRMYPNPAKDKFNIQSDNQIREVFMFGITGNLISRFNVNDFSHSIDVSGLKTGSYIINVVTDKATHRQVIQIAR
jgi:hypothetical protein